MTFLVGLMSGTSLDGISAALARFRSTPRGITGELIAFTSVPYTAAQRERLASALVGGTPAEYCQVNFDVGEWLAGAAEAVMEAGRVPRSEIAAIASHGQTIWHIPGHSTWQTGEAAVIAERTGLPVISDFRVRDMAAGGQGAPLVPIADQLLFAAEGHTRALQNIGGIGNVTIVPPAGSSTAVRAFDTGPGVVVIDTLVRMLEPSMRFDVDGRLALSGRVIPSVVAATLTDPYFAAPPPKSTGRELFTPAWVSEFASTCRAAAPGCTTADILATAVDLTAAAVADSFLRFVPEQVDEVVVSGGGARNPALVAALRAHLTPRRVVQFDELFFDGEAKEAVAFALLGYLHLQGQPGNVPTATGARGPRVLGKLTPAGFSRP